MIQKTIVRLTLLSAFLAAARAAEQPRVYIEESQSWTLNGWSPFTGLLGRSGEEAGHRPSRSFILSQSAARNLHPRGRAKALIL